MGFLLKLLLILIVARLAIGAFKLLLGGGQRKRRAAAADPVQDKRQRVRRKLDEDIVDAEFEDVTEDKRG